MTKHHTYKEVDCARNQYPTMLQQINELINPHKNRILQVAQSALPESQFSAFKKLFLDEFGQKGLESELANLFTNESNNQHHMAGHGQEYTCTKGGAIMIEQRDHRIANRRLSTD